jgi:hypothetical protein
MNNIKNFLALILLIMCGFASCDDFMDVHKKWIQDGEIIYAPKPVDLQFWAGVEKITLFCSLLNSPYVKSIDVYWNNEVDSLIFPVSPSTGLDVYQIAIENLEPIAYTFKVRTTDVSGNHSAFLTGVASAIDPDFVKTLVPREVSRLNIVAAAATIFWTPAPNGLLYNEVRYTTNEGEVKLLKTFPNESSTLCPDAQRKMEFAEYRSLFIPDNSLDTVYSEWTKTAFNKAPLYIYGPGVNQGVNNVALAFEIPFDETNPFVYVWEGECMANWFRYQVARIATSLNFRPATANESPLVGIAWAGDNAVTNWNLNKPELLGGNYRITLNLNDMTIAVLKLP